MAGRGYDASAILDLIAAQGGRRNISTQRDRKAQRSVDPAIDRQRILVEGVFNKLKHFQKTATRSHMLTRNDLAAILIACSRLRARHQVSAS